MRFIPIASDGWRFILPLVLLGTFLLFLPQWVFVSLGILLLGAAAFCAYFFRDPERKIEFDERLIYSPGDGRVLDVAVMESGAHAGWSQVRIFLSVFDGHIQRAPGKGRVEKIRYKKGIFLDARHPNAHLENEQNELTLRTSFGPLIVTQIAGLIARRIVCWVQEGAELAQGDRFGLIRFGSQVDVLLPPKTEIVVTTGTRVIGGKTVLAKWLD